ncbi:MAG: hypothetical protein IPP77_04110 [Bacteroidetes bacterium]|nr:hypothetical protein [Bacteroidota bacterium]
MSAKKLPSAPSSNPSKPVIGIFATCDPRIDKDSRTRAANIVKMVADSIEGDLKLPDGKSVEIVYSGLLVDGETQADQVAAQFKKAGVNILVCAPDTWAFPQLTVISLLSHFPKDTPLNFTCGNSGPRPGVVFTHACSGAISQYGGLVHINVGNWPDTGLNPEMSAKTKSNLVDWCYAAVAYQGLKGRRIVIFGHDSMGMETALADVPAIRNTFGLEVTRLDMKLLSDMLQKESYDKKELKKLRTWLEKHAGRRIELRDEADSKRLDQSLALYLIVRDIIKELDGIGGGFMSQLEWGSDLRGLPLPVADIMESLFNSTFDHNGPKPVVPFATEADVQALITQVVFSYLSGGNPPLFMDFRKVWEPWELQQLAKKAGVKLQGNTIWEKKGLVDGNNSGSASFNWAAKPGSSEKEVMSKISFPLANSDYFPGMGNSVTFLSPGGIEGLAGRLAYSTLSGMYSMVWDEASSVAPPEKISKAICAASSPSWPHTFVVPKHATMMEYKQYAPANHFHMTWNLNAARLQYWMDLTNILSVTPWAAKPVFREGIDRPVPLLFLINGGEDHAKMLRKRK